MSIRALTVTVFLAGLASLATEMSATRLVAPFFGDSNVVWANVIGLTLGFLALGYWLGGRLADARPRPGTLGQVLLSAAVLLAVVPFAARPLLDAALHGFDTISVGVVLGSFLAVLALFVLPVTLIGATAPFAVRLALPDVGQAGRVAGRLYAVSTVGSIVGTFVAALVAIPLLGTRRTILATAVVLALAALPLAPRRALAVALAIAAAGALPPGAVKASGGTLWETESPYQYVRVVQNADGSRALQLNEGVADQSVWYPHSVLTGGYWDLFLVLPRLVTPPPRTMLVLGDAGGTIPRAYARFYPHVRIDGVELDPAVTSAARRFLGLAANPPLRTITSDARVYLERIHRRYDLIVVDAYRQPYIPFQLTTREFFALVREHLTADGAVALNVAAIPGDRRLTAALGTTLLSDFPDAWRWSALRFNDLLIAFRRPPTRAELVRRVGTVAAPLRSLVPLFRRELAAVHASGAAWTDDRAPVEWVTDWLLLEQIRRGQGLDERYLPTSP